ncbi:MAG: hypothetical protein COY66_06760 [Candidatus Kerfeldbacteria bacterium CG_4_10_14_0_8_um_filter_42_10]|uniref:Uncharacterized protein n=1 Tax=Candidatus Kerfeldbacteria bacterium CG_4_10_14_0_8_um_filter_42_10 TaxID=2014248 RepID=A0A2M7RFF9_9BACT|nr:MAG: hypothetical protein COY66_06760 [Candidatus Kerfeldbacteria bacterium CG_4_10_14_0_8_um_filter_42_10]
MKKIIIIFAAAVFLFVLSIQQSAAGTYIDPQTGHDDYAAGNCIMVTTRAEADNNHVYTLNPDNTIMLNFYYSAYWSRNARCDELQFHVDHNTTGAVLINWLDSVARSWYDNIGSSHYKHQTVSTSRHEWFFVNEDGIHRIPDWLTALSWGLLINDRYSIPANHTTDFYDSVTIGAPLNFSEGQYADKIHDIWLEGDDDYSTLPERIEEEINLVKAQANVFNTCTFSWYSAYPGNPWRNLFDWTWMLHNPGCPLA